ncbi:nicotinic acid mononucleotide adenylyltransferase, NAD(P)-dependent [Luteimonas sp. 9C]|uniref:nicotinate-nucleotide adenylyltransferase n=1 Tax=Luteimonas sp. 9C TaxID=2653148 RepID=UPI0012EEEFE9|nr:nicotinate-nucleotide adenylyltransferase [Luteimonas sp. 9C]VXB52316.1 nicotinic acid mononucleotide adenylyltransferase, NAD(P)-dependent [Luteimonas sp. 9C]
MTLHLVYGGTFDPIHRGHLAIACAARDALGCTVHLMPAGDPPHRAPPGADGAMRAAMVARAIEGVPGLVLDRRELHRQGRSFTVDTLAELREELGPARPLAWLVGADSLLGLPGWHRWHDLFGLAHLVVAERPGSALDAALPAGLADALRDRWTRAPLDLQAAPAGRVLRLLQPLSHESATAVRARLSAGASTGDALVPAVAAFIQEKGLYGAAARAPL